MDAKQLGLLASALAWADANQVTLPAPAGGNVFYRLNGLGS